MRTSFLLLFGVILCGCYKINYTTASPVKGSPDIDLWHHRVIYGIVEIPSEVDTFATCPKGVSAVHTETSILNGLVTSLSSWFVGIPIYTPQTVQVWCASSGPAALGPVEVAPEDAVVEFDVAE